LLGLSAGPRGGWDGVGAGAGVSGPPPRGSAGDDAGPGPESVVDDPAQVPVEPE
jgi:hypothetical protein